MEVEVLYPTVDSNGQRVLRNVLELSKEERAALHKRMLVRAAEAMGYELCEDESNDSMVSGEINAGA